MDFIVVIKNTELMKLISILPKHSLYLIILSYLASANAHEIMSEKKESRKCFFFTEIMFKIFSINHNQPGDYT